MTNWVECLLLIAFSFLGIAWLQVIANFLRLKKKDLNRNTRLMKEVWKHDAQKVR